MFGGLDRARMVPHIKDFIFPHLHKCSRENASKRMTAAIRAHIDADSLSPEAAEKFKKCYTSWSMRKASMTENRINAQLDIQEEYERSGHTIGDGGMTAHAEGYVGSTPAKNAPGGCALADYPNPHVIPVPFTFASICHAHDKIHGFVTLFFPPNDVPQLQDGGSLIRVTMTAGARIVATYNSLVKDFGVKHRIVSEIHKSAKEASIDDPMVPIDGGPRHVEVLRNWSS